MQKKKVTSANKRFLHFSKMRDTLGKVGRSMTPCGRQLIVHYGRGSQGAKQHVKNLMAMLYTYLTTYSLWSAMHELSLLLNYQVYR